MKKLILSLAVLGLVLALASCNKSKNDGTNPSQVTQGISFSIKPGLTPGGLKSDCFSQTLSYAKVWLNVLPANTPYPGNPVTVSIFYIAGQPYTNSIQLAPGQYSLSDFIIYNDNQTPTNTGDDIVLCAAPHSGSAYAQYVTTSLNIPFTVAKFAKLQQPVECVCYQPTHWQDFGFLFFIIQDLTLREVAFFGDLCAKDFAKYTGSDYAKQYLVSGGSPLQPDMPAIFKIDVLRNGIAMGSFSNDSLNWWGVGAPRKVQYADRYNIVDNFEFRLSVLVKTGASFSFVYFFSWYSTDGGPLYPNNTSTPPVADKDGNGVIDFSLGYCNPNADLLLNPYMNLPSTCTYNITSYGPGSLGAYVDAALTVGGAPNDYLITTQTYPSYCVETDYFIQVGQTYTMNVFSSLYPPSALTYPWIASKPWDKLNWLINHLSWYPGYKWYDLQGAIWKLCGWTGSPSEPGVTYPTSTCSCLGWTMYSDATTYGANYQVPTGGWACVIMSDAANPIPHTQTMFVQIDP